jgi:hypothetical protein
LPSYWQHNNQKNNAWPNDLTVSSRQKSNGLNNKPKSVKVTDTLKGDWPCVLIHYIKLSNSKFQANNVSAEVMTAGRMLLSVINYSPAEVSTQC